LLVCLTVHVTAGYGVVAVNFHGSTGFGQAYTDSIKTDWGGQPYRDAIEAVDYILGQKAYLDSSRVGAMGASYGGYMMNWINGHNDRFKCLVNHDGIFNLKALYYSTEEVFFPEWEFGFPWDNSGDRGAKEYDKWNPMEFISEWKTPTLVIQGGIDHRIVESEGLSTFTALQRRGIPSQLLFFPDENHWCLKPMNSVKWHNTVQAWLDKWLM
jgi:dipeptidyl aminopeptidase/acylaminoacyl peptidase